MVVSKLKLIGKKENCISISGSLKSNSHLKYIVSMLCMGRKRNIPTLQKNLNATEFNLDMKINASRLGSIVPGTSGETKGILKVCNTTYKSKLLSNVTIKNLKWKELTVSFARIGVDLQSEKKIKGHMAMYFEGITQPNSYINLTTLNIKGNEEKHMLQLYMQSNSIFQRLHLKGSFDRKIRRWRRELDEIPYSTSIQLTTLDKIIALDRYIQNPKKDIRTNCWNNSNIELFFSQDSDIGKRNYIMVNFHHYNINNFIMPKMFLSNQSQRRNNLFNKEKETFLNPIIEKPLKGNLSVNRGNLNSIQSTNNSKSLILVFNSLYLNVCSNNNGIEMSWLIYLTNDSQLNGKLKISNLEKKRELSGNINIKNLNFTTENPFSLKKENILEGVFNANLQLKGNIENPQIFGKMKIGNIGIRSNFMPFDTKINQLTINFEGMHFTCFAIIRTQKGEINVRGTVNWRHLKNWHAIMIAQGKNMHYFTFDRIF